MILEKAEKASTCGQHEEIFAGALVRSAVRISHRIRSHAGRMASTSASVLPESPAPNRINRGRVAVTSRRPRPGCLEEGSAYGGDLHAVRSGQAGKLPGGFDEAGTGEAMSDL